MFSDDVESLAAEIHEVMELLRRLVSAVDDVHHVGGENEGRPIPLEVAEHLSVPEELPEVNVKEVAGLLHHDVVVVAVTDPENVSHDAVASAGPCKALKK